MKKALFLGILLGSLPLSAGVILAQVADLAAVIVSPTAGASYQVGEIVPFAGNATGGTAPYNFQWAFGDGDSAAGQSYDKVYNQPGTYIVTFLVRDPDNHSADTSESITITAVTPPTPTVDLKVNGTDGPAAVTTDGAATLSWTSTDATSCTASDSWSGTKATTGSESTSVLNTVGSFTYTLTCTGAGGSATDHIVINVSASNPAAPIVDLKINDGNGPITVASGTVATLSWTSANATSCTASNAWSGTKATNGSESTGALNTPGFFTYTLTCTGAGGSASDNVTITVQAPSTGAAPVISDIHVTDITQTSAIVHWTTDILADSRVIYDTVSHPTLGAAPNFGYASSTNTLDANPKVTTHAVTLSSLAPNTQYFFRVLSQS